eukprot:16859_1
MPTTAAPTTSNPTTFNPTTFSPTPFPTTASPTTPFFTTTIKATCTGLCEPDIPDWHKYQICGIGVLQLSCPGDAILHACGVELVSEENGTVPKPIYKLISPSTCWANSSYDYTYKLFAWCTTPLNLPGNILFWYHLKTNCPITPIPTTATTNPTTATTNPTTATTNPTTIIPTTATINPTITIIPTTATTNPTTTIIPTTETTNPSYPTYGYYESAESSNNLCCADQGKNCACYKSCAGNPCNAGQRIGLGGGQYCGTTNVCCCGNGCRNTPQPHNDQCDGTQSAESASKSAEESADDYDTNYDENYDDTDNDENYDDTDNDENLCCADQGKNCACYKSCAGNPCNAGQRIGLGGGQYCGTTNVCCCGNGCRNTPQPHNDQCDETQSAEFASKSAEESADDYDTNYDENYDDTDNDENY